MKIVLLHGLFMHGLIMAPLEKRLVKLGWQVENLSYPSTKTDKRHLFQKLDDIIASGPALLVGHSLGGLVIKEYLLTHQVPTSKVPMVITLGTPHQGTRIVDELKKVNLHTLLGTSLDFGLLPGEFEQKWPLPQKLISVAGNLNIGARPLLERVMRDDVTESDGTVSVEETQIAGMSEHIVVKQTHSSMVFAKQTAELIDGYAKQVANS